MSDVATPTRGEYQEFDLSRVPTSGQFVFVSPSVMNLTLLLVRGRTQVIDGEVIKTEDIVARFRDFYFRTDDPALAERIRKSNAFASGTVRELSSLQREGQSKQEDALRSQLLANPEMAARVIGSLRPTKSPVPLTEKAAS